MTRAPETETIWAGDALIVGAGAAGVLTALALREHGLTCTLVDERGFGAGQSNHSHGYMHKGYIYLSGGRALAPLLRRGSAAWARIIRGTGVVPATEESRIAFDSSVAAASAVAAWRMSGLDVLRADPPEGISREEAAGGAFATPEPAYDFTTVFSHLAGRLRQVPQLHGRVVRLCGDGNELSGVEVAPAGGGLPVRVRAATYVLAAGWSNPRLIRAATSYRGRAVSRMSFMLVAASPDLPPLSVILPAGQHYGLFAVSRRLSGRGHAWLVSNFLSLDYEGHREPAVRLWLRATLQTLAKVAPVLRDPEIGWGLYTAPKGELRDRPGELRAHAWESYDMPNFLALAPTKLTLAPLLAEEVGGRIAELVARHPDRGAPGVEFGPTLPVIGERWRREPLMSLEELCERHSCRDAAGWLGARVGF